jgi:hypothetical protein
MLNYLLFNHVVGLNLSFYSKITPKLEVLIEFGPGFGDSSRQQRKKLIQKNNNCFI